MDTWTTQVTEIGLSMMTEKKRRERIEGLMNGSTLNCSALAALIDECVTLVAALGRIKGDKISSQVSRINGEDAVASSDPDALVEWIFFLQHSLETI